MKVMKRKFRVDRLLFFLFLISVLIYLSALLVKKANYKLELPRIKNIYVTTGKLIAEQKIIELAGIEDYPSCFFTTNASIKRRLLASPYIKKVTVKKDWFCVVNIKVEEYKILFQKRIDDKIVLENNSELLSDYLINDVPILINYVASEEYLELIKQMTAIDDDILSLISEIEYNPNEVDKERFLLSMKDGNYVYVTLYTFDKLNYYLKVLPELEGKKGIFYWDSGNYFKIIE